MTKHSKNRGKVGHTSHGVPEGDHRILVVPHKKGPRIANEVYGFVANELQNAGFQTRVICQEPEEVKVERASHDVLAALKALARLSGKWFTVPPDDPLFAIRVKEARHKALAAIAKAEGRPKPSCRHDGDQDRQETHTICGQCGECVG